MCGIAGIVYKNSKTKREDIKILTQALAHRGPDGEGFYFGNNFALGHRRLAILDISEAGHQPMQYEGKNGEYVIVFNGEIYNYLELKNTLKNEGYIFSTYTDTEVLIASYDRWGIDCLEKFNGMWAFVIYDKKKNILFGSRDRFGVKPFYYFDNNNIFMFASEIKALMKLPYLKFSINENILFDYLLIGLEEQDASIFKNIYELAPSHAFVFDLENFSVKFWKYYNLKYENVYEEFNEKKANNYSQELKEYIYNAVKLRLRSDVPIGSCLSGGLDSSSIVCLISEISKKDVMPQLGFKQNVFTAAYLDKDVDESKYAEIVVEKSGAQWHLTYPTEDGLIEDLNDIIYYQEIPFGSTSIYAQYKVMQLAKEKGIKVLLDGQGGDELFTGYYSYYPVFFKEILYNVDIKRLLKEWSNLENSPITKRYLLSELMKHLLVDRLIPDAFLSTLYYKTQNRAKYFNRDFINKFKDRLRFYIQKLPKRLNEQLYLYITGKNLKALLRYEDRNSMRFSIEARTPFADDIQLIEYVFNIPSSYKIYNGWSKYLLRESMKGILPEEIRLRKDKVGFATPEKKWLWKNKDLFLKILIDNKKLLADYINLNLVIEDFNNGKIFKEKFLIWRIINFTIWYNIFAE